MAQNEIDQASQEPISQETYTGRSVFLVETTAAGISVQTALLSNNNQLLRAPAVFPDIEYAFAQIDELKSLVSRHFSEAARVGAQVLAAQQSKSLEPASTATASAAPESSAEPEVPLQLEARAAKPKKAASR